MYLSEEFEEMNEEYNAAKNEFISKMFEYCSSNKIKPPLSEKEEPKKIEDNKKKEENTENQNIKGVNDMYRKIAKETHPDATRTLEEEQIDKRTKIYKSISTSKKDGDFWKVFKALVDLDIDIGDIDRECIDYIEQSINELEVKINNINNDIMYKWYKSDESGRNNIMKFLTAKQPAIE